MAACLTRWMPSTGFTPAPRAMLGKPDVAPSTKARTIRNSTGAVFAPIYHLAYLQEILRLYIRTQRSSHAPTPASAVWH